MKTIKFGRYYYDEDELQEIEWIVLDEMPDGKKLLLSKYCIEAMQYEYEQNDNPNPKWDNCVLREWLNGYFIDNFFTSSEKEKLCPITITTPTGIELNDKITLLCIEEVVKYLPNEKDRKSKPTPWAKRSKCNEWGEEESIYTDHGFCTWLLRNPSSKVNNNWTGINPKGSIDEIGGDIFFSGEQGIRPIILLDTKEQIEL